MPDGRPHICHLITGLGAGGTPVMLRNVLRSLAGADLRFTAIGLIDDMAIGRDIEAIGVPVHTLGMTPGRPSASAVWRLVRLLRRDPPGLIQTWLYHADLLGSLAAKLCGRPPVIWNIRHATLTPGVDSRSTLWTAGLCARVSRRWPAAIVCNSHAGRKTHIDAGYDATKFEWIPNGFDVQRFQPSDAARIALRGELGVSSQTPLVGLVARFSHLKGHDIFVRAMAVVARERPDVHFVLCGRDIDASNRELAALIEPSGASERWHLLGERSDIPVIQAALDVATCPSRSEAFSNSIGEALACGVPCIASDVGDSASLVEGVGAVVPVGDSDTLARETLSILSLPADDRAELSARARHRIESNYSLPVVASRYDALWRKTLSVRPTTAERRAA